MGDGPAAECPKCGNNNDAGAQVCAKCGLDLELALEEWDEYVTGPQASHPPIILLSDDDVGVLTLFGLMLERAGFRVARAPDPFFTLELAERLHPDLITTDISKPRMDGIEMTARLKADPYLHDIPVIILSSRGDPESVERGFAAGAVEYLTKPILQHDLATRVARVLGIEPPRPLPFVLFVVDEGVPLTYRELLKRGFYSPRTENRADDPIAAVKRLEPVVIAVPFRLADVSGLDVLVQLKAEPGVRDIPVVMLADRPKPRREQRALALGAFAVHSGPRDANELAAVFRAALATSERASQVGTSHSADSPIT